MKVPFVFGPGDLRLCEVEAPRAGPDDVVLAVGAVGICGSDLGYVAQGGIAGPTARPVPIGHELAGVVAEVGSRVTTVRPGDRVVLNPLVGMVGNGGAEGGFAPRLLVRGVADRPKALLALPDHLSIEVGALVEPLAVAIHAVNRLGAKPGDRVAVFGAGPIGLGALIVLAQRGIEDVVSFDLSPFRRARALALRARVAADPRERPARDVLTEVHGAVPLFGGTAPGTTHFLEASGGPVLPDILAMARANATICVTSAQKQPVPTDFMRVMSKELTLTGALGYPTELPDAIALLAGGVDPAAMVSHSFAGDDFIAAFAMAQRAGEAAKVLVHYDG